MCVVVAFLIQTYRVSHSLLMNTYFGLVWESQQMQLVAELICLIINLSLNGDNTVE